MEGARVEAVAFAEGGARQAAGARQERTCSSQNGRGPAGAEAFLGWCLFGPFLGAAAGGET